MGSQSVRTVSLPHVGIALRSFEVRVLVLTSCALPLVDGCDSLARVLVVLLRRHREAPAAELERRQNLRPRRLFPLDWDKDTDQQALDLCMAALMHPLD